MVFEYSVPDPFHFENVIKTHGWFQLVPFYWDETQKALTWAVRLNDYTPRSITLSQSTLNPNHIAVFSESGLSSVEQEIVCKKIRCVFNLDLDLSEFYNMAKNYSLLDQVERRGMGRLMRSESVYEDVFKSICGTNIQWKQATRIINNIAQVGETVPGTEYHLFPSFEIILQNGETFLREVGRVGYRSGYLMDLAARFADGDAMAERVENGELAPSELSKYFESFKGIGKVTARYLAALYGHFQDLAVDSLVISYMRERHFNGQTPTIKQIEDFYAKFGRWRYLAYWMEFIVAGGWSPDKNE